MGDEAQGQTPTGVSDTGQAEENLGQGEDKKEPSYSLSEFGNEFLSTVDETHKEIIVPYLNKWDAGVTRRFQELGSQLRPYQELGVEPDVLKAAVHIMNLLESDPKQIYDTIVSDPEIKKQLGLEEELPESQNQFQGLPPEFEQQFQKQQQMLEALATLVMDQMDSGKQAETEAQEDAELEEYLQLLNREFGQFDETYVLGLMNAGIDGPTAVKTYQQTVGSQIRPTTPVVLGGNGNVPAEQPQNIGQFSNKDVQTLIASVLGQVNKEG